MEVHSETAPAAIYDRILRRIQRHLANRVRFPFEIRLWGDRAYRFGKASLRSRSWCTTAMAWPP